MGGFQLEYLSVNFSYKITLLNILALLTIALTSCQGGNTPTNKVNIDEKVRNNPPINGNITPLPPIFDYFACKPAENAFVAAHRGTHIGSEFPENALISLQALIKNGVPFAEIDVAKLKDDTHILFHDGTWERRAAGPKDILSKPLAATTWDGAQKLLLKDTNGNITAARPSAFADILTAAKDKIYLEIDFKSSANEAEIIAAITAADMLDQVILISYNTEQALRHHKLAPTTALSVGIFKPGDIETIKVAGIPTNVMTAWTGKGPLSQKLTDALRAKNIPILAASFYALDAQVKQTGDKTLYAKFANRPDLVVTDMAFDAQQVLEITGESLQTMETCLAKRTGD